MTAHHLPPLLMASAATAVWAGPPNILILLTDDQRWDTVRVNNPGLAMETPHLDRLARDGINFQNAFVTTPICAVSRAGILTGRYARNAQVHCFLIPPPDEVWQSSYPARMKEAGYFLGQLGKYGVGATPAQRALFDLFDADLAQGEPFRDHQGERLHDSEWLTRRTLDFLDQVPSGQPFVLQVNYKAPHPSAAVAPEDRGKLADAPIDPVPTDTPEDRAALPPSVQRSLSDHLYHEDLGTPERRQRWIREHLEKIISVDRSVGRIREALADRGLAENTVILFLSDHGTQFGEKQLGGKWMPYEQSLRIPFFIYDPRRPDRASTRVEQLVLNIDIAPTLLALAGLPPEARMDGASLVPLMRGDPDVIWRDHFFFEHQTAPAMVPRPIARHMGVRSEQTKYVRWTDESPVVEEFYHLPSDPWERHNLAQDTPQRAERLRRMFAQWERENPDTYTHMLYSHRPQAHPPEIDWPRFRTAHPAAYARIKGEIERRGVTWEDAFTDWDLRWEIGLAARFFY